MSDFSDRTDRDLLVQLTTDMCWLKKIVSNHLKQHFMIKLAVIGASLSAVVSITIAIIAAIR